MILKQIIVITDSVSIFVAGEDSPPSASPSSLNSPSNQKNTFERCQAGVRVSIQSELPDRERAQEAGTDRVTGVWVPGRTSRSFP